MRELVGLLLLLGLPGCLQCQPSLDVRHCEPGSERCAPGPGDRVADWNPDLAGVFPDVARLLAETPRGSHRHADWTAAQAEALWDFWGVPDGPERELFLRHDGGLYRVRVLAC